MLLICMSTLILFLSIYLNKNFKYIFDEAKIRLYRYSLSSDERELLQIYLAFIINKYKFFKLFRKDISNYFYLRYFWNHIEIYN
jgi:hypothetical protein